MTIFTAEWSGKLPSVNEWTRTTMVHGRPVIYKTTGYRKAVESIAWAMVAARRPGVPIDYLINLDLTVWLWKMRDTDNALKPICDALVAAAVLKDDRFIRNVCVWREYHPRSAEDRLIVKLIQ